MMDNKLKKVEDIFTETLGKAADAFGISRAVAQLYAILYLSPKPLSLDEMAEHLKVSKGNISVNIRILNDWQAVRKVWQRGSRKDYYVAELDIKKIIMNKLRDGLNRRIGEIIGETSKIEKILNSSNKNTETLTPEEKKVLSIYKERIKKIKDLNNLANKSLSLLRHVM